MQVPLNVADGEDQPMGVCVSSLESQNDGEGRGQCDFFSSEQTQQLPFADQARAFG